MTVSPRRPTGLRTPPAALPGSGSRPARGRPTGWRPCTGRRDWRRPRTTFKIDHDRNARDTAKVGAGIPILCRAHLHFQQQFRAGQRHTTGRLSANGSLPERRRPQGGARPIDSGFFSPGERSRYHDIFNCLVHHGDHYLLLADYADYIATQARVDAHYLTPAQWQCQAIPNVAGMGSISADRMIADYANDTWKIHTL